MFQTLIARYVWSHDSLHFISFPFNCRCGMWCKLMAKLGIFLFEIVKPLFWQTWQCPYGFTDLVYVWLNIQSLEIKFFVFVRQKHGVSVRYLTMELVCYQILQQTQQKTKIFRRSDCKWQRLLTIKSQLTMWGGLICEG